MYTPSFIKKENQFTDGNEYMITRKPVVSGDVGYTGYYNITAEGPFTGRVFTETSKPLFPFRVTNTKQSSIYVELITAKGKKTDLDYNDLVVSFAKPEEEDFKRGYFQRYFIKQRNDINGRVKEVDKQQFEDLSKTGEGLNPNFYRSLVLRWKLTGPRKDIKKGDLILVAGVEDTNKRTVIQKDKSMNGLE